MEDFKVFEGRICRLYLGSPPISVKQFDLHTRQCRFGGGIVVPVADTAHRWNEAGIAGSTGERPRGELDS